MTSGASAKRQAERVPLALAVNSGVRIGETRDMSGTGMYFETTENFAPGSQLDFWVDLEHGYPYGPLRLICSGQIVRVERRGKKLGIAVSIESHRFQVAGSQDPASPDRGEDGRS